MRTCIRCFPRPAGSGAEVSNVAVLRINRNCGHAPRIVWSDIERSYLWPCRNERLGADERPTSRPGERGGRERRVRIHPSQFLGGPHCINVLQRLQSQAGGDRTIRKPAIRKEPFLSLPEIAFVFPLGRRRGRNE